MGLFDKVTSSLFGGSSGSRKSSSRLDPRIFDMFKGTFDRAQGVADDLEVRQFAPFTPTFESGAGTVRGITGGPGQQTTARGATVAGRNANFTPSNVSAGNFLQGDVGAYMNPYTDQVVDRTLADLDRTRQQTLQQVGDRAHRARAFGGDRHGVAEAETNRGFADAASRAAAGLRSDAFDSATGLMRGDLDRRFAADQANQQAGLSGAQINNETARTLAGIGGSQQEQQLQGAQAEMALGQLEQAFTQQELDALRNLPAEQLDIIVRALGITPAGGAGTVSRGRDTTSSTTGFLTGAADVFSSLRPPV